MAILFRGVLAPAFKAWTGVESVDQTTRLQIVDDPIIPGTPTLRVEVRQGDLVAGTNGVRAELWKEENEQEGVERWYAWRTLFPADFPSFDQWAVWCQWHQAYLPPVPPSTEWTTAGVSPPVEFALGKGKLCFNLNDVNAGARTLWTAPIPRGRWMDVILHVRWSLDPTLGFVEVYIDGKVVVPKTFAATNFKHSPPLPPNYLKFGFYRARDIAPTTVIYHQSFRSSDALADVLPVPAPVPVPGPTPPPAASPFKARMQDLVGKWWTVEVKPE